MDRGSWSREGRLASGGTRRPRRKLVVVAIPLLQGRRVGLQGTSLRIDAREDQKRSSTVTPGCPKDGSLRSRLGRVAAIGLAARKGEMRAGGVVEERAISTRDRPGASGNKREKDHKKKRSKERDGGGQSD